MQFICGVVRDGKRRIFSAESQPTLENLDELSAQLPGELHDWGPGATLEAASRTAYAILRCVTDEFETERLMEQYATEVVQQSMAPERMWIMPVKEVEIWLRTHRRVM